MGRILSDKQRKRLDERVAEAERRAKAQIVTAVIERSDSYVEIPWEAFAAGASIAGLGAFVFSLLYGSFSSHAATLITVSAMLAAGGAMALLAVFVPWFARLFLSSHRAETEVLQYAQSLFLTREIFATKERTGVLLLVSLFERRVVLLPDMGLNDRLAGDAAGEIIARMTALLARGDIADAMEEGLERLALALMATASGGPEDDGGNELPDGVIEERGA